MSRYKTKQAFITRLLNNLPTGISLGDVAFENQEPPFDPSNKGIWLDTHYQEASSESTGKTVESSNEQRGFFQIDVNVPLTNKNYDNDLLIAIDELSVAFQYGLTIGYNGQSVDLLDSTTPNSAENGAWYRRFITVNYLTFSNK